MFDTAALREINNFKKNVHMQFPNNHQQAEHRAKTGGYYCGTAIRRKSITICIQHTI